MSGTLFLVSTPIGNLEDITLRALRVLRESDLIAAEDTRRTAKLLAHYAISTPTISFHRHNTRSRVSRLVDRIERGATVALVSDAGTPTIADPGIELVRACVGKGIPVVPVPGASAPLSAAIASGFPLDPLTIFGFVPARAKDRKLWFERARATTHTLTFFEAPHRIQQTLTEAHGMFGDRPILLAREITKVHEQFLRGTASEIMGRSTEHRGEFTLVVGPIPALEISRVGASDHEIFAEFGRSTEHGLASRRQIVVNLAKKYGASPREVYSIIERLKSAGL